MWKTCVEVLTHGKLVVLEFAGDIRRVFVLRFLGTYERHIGSSWKYLGIFYQAE